MSALMFAHPRRASREFSLQTSLAVFSTLICLTIVAVGVINMVHARTVAIAVTQRATQNLAESIAQQAADTFEAVDGVLLALSERVQSQGMGKAQRAGLNEAMSALVTAMPRLHGLLIIDDRGRLVVSNGSAAERSDLRFDRQPYFRYHRDHPGRSVRISGAVQSEIENAPVIEMTRRLDYPDGRFAGVAVAQIAVAYFEQSFAKVDIGKLGAITLVADDATIVARRPRVGAGRTMANALMFAGDYKYDWTGSYVTKSVVDGVPVLVAFRRLDQYPMVVHVSFAQSEYLADWRSDTLASAVGLLLVVMMIAGLAAGLGAQIQRRRRAEDTLAEMALVDGLTGLANRRQFDTALEREWRNAARDRTTLGLLMLDVDSFKAYNDRYGHQSGDDVLTVIARTIAENIVRPRDIAARYGGEEFAVILPGTDTASAVVVAERIRCAVAALAIPHADGIHGTASLSIGAASAAPTGVDARAALIAGADGALYVAKRAGRNRTSTPVGASDAAAGR